MEFCFFTKFWPAATVADLARMAREFDADGLDLGVRPGSPVTPDNVGTALPEAVCICREEGARVSMLTLDGKDTDPHDPVVESIFAAAGAAGVRWIKLGYWKYQWDADYWAGVEAQRATFVEIGKLAKKHGVVACYHNHFGSMYGMNAAGLMLILRGLDRDSLGVYLDPGHLALGGEPIPLAVAMIRDYLRIAAIKSPAWYREPKDGKATWMSRFISLREGMVDCALFFDILRQVGFAGVVSFHGESSVSPEQNYRQVKDDIAYCRGLLKKG